MNPESTAINALAQRDIEGRTLKLAKAEGWRYSSRELYVGGIPDLTPWITPDGRCAQDSEVPEYFSDPYAIQQLKSKLTPEQRGKYINHLCDICSRKKVGPSTAIELAFFASTHQEALALGITLGLWTYEGAFHTFKDQKD